MSNLPSGAAPPAWPAPVVPATRPVGVTILAVLAAIGAAILALFGLLLMAASAAFGALLGGGEGGLLAALGAAAGVVLLVFAVLDAIVAYGLFTRKRWAWYVTLVLVALQGLSMLTSILAGDIIGPILGLGIAALVIWYLLSPTVQAWFGVSHKTPWTYATRA